MSDSSSDNESSILKSIDVTSIVKKYEQAGTSGIKSKSKFDISDDSDDDFGLNKPSVFETEIFQNLLETKKLINESTMDAKEDPMKKTSLKDNLATSLETPLNPDESINISSSDDEAEPIQQTKTKDQHQHSTRIPKDLLELLSDSDVEDEDSRKTKNFKPPNISNSTSCGQNTKYKKTRKSIADKEAERLEKEQLKLEKQKERELKKQEAERNKEIKKALLAAHKTTKPEECVKFITVSLDKGLMSKTYSSAITRHLKELGSKYQETEQIIPDSITWSRKVQRHLVDDCGAFHLKEEVVEEDHLLVILDASKIAKLVTKKDLSTHICGVKSIFENKRITLAIHDMENYFKSKSDSSKTKKKAKTDTDYTDVPKILKGDLEYALTELQLLCDCCYRFVNTSEELGLMVMQFTKSIAMIPHKMDKNEKLKQAEWYIEGDNKDSVKVDNDGNGLQRLWQQHLTSFPLARLETAETIISKYPTLSSVMEAYDMCSNENEKVQLLQFLPIRRVAGPMSGGRNLGPELSKKMYTFYNSFDGDALL